MYPVVVTLFNPLFLPAVVGYLIVIACSSFFLVFDCYFPSLASPSLGDVTDQLVGLQDGGLILWGYLLPLAWWRVLILPSFVPRPLL